MKSEYLCVFGISNGLPAFTPGEQLAAFGNGISFMTCHGSRGRIYWFLLKKLDKVYTYPHIPRYSRQDAEDFCERYIDYSIVDQHTFGDLWSGRQVYNMIGLEENVFETWCFDRIVCLGDSMHKVCHTADLPCEWLRCSTAPH
jgi:FAD dependent monooxygenase